MDETPTIWNRVVQIEELNRMLEGTLASALGMKLAGLGADYMEGTMPVDQRTVQPFGILHGGASVALAETLGSMAAYLVIDPEQYAAVGLDINANHIRTVSSGIVRGRVTPIHIGRRTHVWQTHVRDAQERLVSIARLTIAIIRQENRE